MASFAIIVKGLEGSSHTITGLNDNTTISELKKKIQIQTGCDINEQRLIYANEEIQDGWGDKTLESLGIENSSTLYLVVRLRGGNDEKLKIKLIHIFL